MEVDNRSPTDDDLQYVEGKQDELPGRIQKRTGETRETVEKAVKESSNGPLPKVPPSPNGSPN